MHTFIKAVALFIIFFTLSCSKQLTEPSEYTNRDDTDDFVHADGKKMVHQGQELLLKGVGLGGWMLQEGYMLGTSGAQHEIRSKLEDLAGVSATDQFYHDWLDHFVTERDVKQIADWGYNSIRLPMHYELYFDVSGNWMENSTGLKLTDDLLSWCKSNNLYLILDLHAAPGGQGNNKDISDRKDGYSLWTDSKYQEMTILMWSKLAERYKDEKAIAGFDLLNEINYDFDDTGNAKGCRCEQNKPLLDLYKKLIDAIRAVDSNHMIILEGNCYGSNYKGLESLPAYDPNKNIALSFHGYWSRNDDSDIYEMLAYRDSLNVPLWRGETGENSNTWFNEMALHMEQQNIGWANWPWKKINNLDGPLIVEPIDKWTKIVNYWNNPSNPMPSTQEAQDALIQFIENIRFENCRLMHGVSIAYLNQPAAPYATHSIPGKIEATEYDYGKYNETWADADYQNISGSSSNTSWNKGVSFRNDGVDIYPNDDELENKGYYVGDIEKGEWLKFELASVLTGVYDVQLRVRQGVDIVSEIKLEIDNVEIAASEITSGENNWFTFSMDDVSITSGKSLKLIFDKGGLHLSSVNFVKK